MGGGVVLGGKLDAGRCVCVCVEIFATSIQLLT